jgi:hypothetical protein
VAFKATQPNDVSPFNWYRFSPPILS